MFARPGQKRSGAWCGSFRGQSYKNGERVLPLVTICGNFTRPVGDKPALLTTDEVETFFHEFGHGLASLLKDVKYKGMGGTQEILLSFLHRSMSTGHLSLRFLKCTLNIIRLVR
jgi:peptidyl-dipeptidase Dcp